MQNFVEIDYCIETLLKETNSCVLSPVGAGAGGVWEGEWRAAGVCQLCSPADRRLLPWYPGAGCQRPGRVMLITLTSDTTQLTSGLHITRSWAPYLHLTRLLEGWKKARALSHPTELFFLAPLIHPGTFTTRKCFPVSCVRHAKSNWGYSLSLWKCCVVSSNMAFSANITLLTANWDLLT